MTVKELMAMQYNALGDQSSVTAALLVHVVLCIFMYMYLTSKLDYVVQGCTSSCANEEELFLLSTMM